MADEDPRFWLLNQASDRFDLVDENEGGIIASFEDFTVANMIVNALNQTYDN